MDTVFWRSSTRIRALGVLLLFTAWWCPREAPAEVPLAVTALGDCPSAERLRQALARRQIPVEATGHTLTMRAVSGGAELTLTNGASVVVVERHIDSADCGALADAGSLIAEAYFVALAKRAAETPQPAAPTGTTPVAMPELSATPPEPKPPAPEASALPEPAAPPPEEGPAPTRTEPSSSHLTLSLLGGADLILGSLAAAGQLGAGYYFATPSLTLELHALLDTATTVGSSPDPVRRAEGRAALRVLKHFGSLPVMPWAGAGASRTELRLLDFPNPPTRTHWSPLFEAGIALDQPLAGDFSLRAELGCRLLLDQEQYLVTPDPTPIGEGPRGACSALVGLGWAPGRVE